MISSDVSRLSGLCIRLERSVDVPCGVCGQVVVVIGEGGGPHVAGLHCANCDRHRGWLPKTIADFLLETISRFGWPTEAITIRNPEFVQTNATAPFGCARGRDVSTLNP
jgi:hypothetical protein